MTQPPEADESKRPLTRAHLSSSLSEQTRQLKEHTDTQVSELRTDMKDRFDAVDHKLDAIVELLDVRKRVETLEAQVEALNQQRSL